MKTLLNINAAELLISGSCISSPRASSFSSTHDYTTGTISYSAEYNSSRACLNNSSYRSISISVEDSTPMVAEFVIPGRQNGPIIQKLGPYTPKRVNVNIEGFSESLISCCPNVSNVCSGLGLPADIPDKEIGGMILVQNQETINSIDGSYNISRSYIKRDN
jgi:hypothetical protein